MSETPRCEKKTAAQTRFFSLSPFHCHHKLKKKITVDCKKNKKKMGNWRNKQHQQPQQQQQQQQKL